MFYIYWPGLAAKHLTTPHTVTPDALYTLCLSILTQILSWLGTDKYSQNTFHTFLVIAVTVKSHRPSALNMPAKKIKLIYLFYQYRYSITTIQFIIVSYLYVIKGHWKWQIMYDFISIYCYEHVTDGWTDRRTFTYIYVTVYHSSAWQRDV